MRQTGEKTNAIWNQLHVMYDLGFELEALLDMKSDDFAQVVSRDAKVKDVDAPEMNLKNQLENCSRRVHEVTTELKGMVMGYSGELQAIDKLFLEPSQLNDFSQSDLLNLRRVLVQHLFSIDRR